MMSRLVILTLMVMMTGCASLSGPANEIRITEYAANAESGFLSDALIGGVRVVQEGSVDACVIYRGKSTAVFAGSCIREGQSSNPAQHAIERF